MKYVTTIFVWSIFITCISAQACTPESPKLIGSTFVNDPIDDNTIGVVATFKVTDIINAVALDSIYMDLDVSLEDESVSVFLTDEFENYEADTISEGFGIIRFQIQLTCTLSTNEITFNQQINDINNNQPEFLQSEYRYRIPMPFPPQIEITQYGVDIIARDIDISNTLITFEVIESDNFVFTTVGTVDSLLKEFKSALIAVRPLEFRGTETFTIKATDSGNPSLSSTATLIIELDEENSVLPATIFSSMYYVVNYIVNSDPLHVAQVTIPITAPQPTIFDMEGEYRDNFALSYEDGLLSIQLISNLSEDDLDLGGFRPIVINASISEFRSAKAVLILQLPAKENTPDVECPVGYQTSKYKRHS